MLRFFRNCFIPCANNAHKPYILRTQAMLAILVIVIFAQFIFYFGNFILLQKTNFLASVMPGVLVDATNRNRLLSNIGKLKVSPLLEKAALLKAEDMAQKGYFAHNSPDGKTPWYWLDKVGYSYAWAGENLAVNFFDSEDIVAAWMNSLTHRQNILNNNYTEIGIGMARGKFEGRDTIFVAQFFGAPASSRSAKEASSLQPEGLATSATNIIPIDNEALRQVPAESFVATESTGSPIVLSKTISKENSQKKISFIGKVFSSPRQIVTDFYLTLFFIISAALLLNVFSRAKRKYNYLLFNGVVVLTALSSLLAWNQFFALQGRVF